MTRSDSPEALYAEFEVTDINPSIVISPPQ